MNIRLFSTLTGVLFAAVLLMLPIAASAQQETGNQITRKENIKKAVKERTERNVKKAVATRKAAKDAKSKNQSKTTTEKQ